MLVVLQVDHEPGGRTAGGHYRPLVREDALPHALAGRPGVDQVRRPSVGKQPRPRRRLGVGDRNEQRVRDVPQRL
jgi:hypothetical protein